MKPDISPRILGDFENTILISNLCATASTFSLRILFAVVEFDSGLFINIKILL